MADDLDLFEICLFIDSGRNKKNSFDMKNF